MVLAAATAPCNPSPRQCTSTCPILPQQCMVRAVTSAFKQQFLKHSNIDTATPVDHVSRRGSKVHGNTMLAGNRGKVHKQQVCD